LSGKDTALVLGVTPQRVSQLAGAGAKKTGVKAPPVRGASATGRARTSGRTATKTPNARRTKVAKKTAAAAKKSTASRSTARRSRRDEVHPAV
jgi:hypothetical protein